MLWSLFFGGGGGWWGGVVGYLHPMLKMGLPLLGQRVARGLELFYYQEKGQKDVDGSATMPVLGYLEEEE